MGVIHQTKQLGSRVVSRTGYPSPARRLINALPVGISIAASEGATIERNVHLSGDVSIGPGATIESTSTIGGNVRVESDALVGHGSSIAGDVIVGERTNLVAAADVCGEITFGKYNAIARRCTFQSKDHFMYKPGIQMRFYNDVIGEPLEHVSKGPIETGNDVWICADATVLGGVTVGHGAVVGARSVVTDDVEPYAIVAGVPAERKGWRFDERTRGQLLDIEWWDWDEEKMRRNEEFFHTDLRTVDDVHSLIR